ncbi:MAG: Glutamyl-tRNA reductase [Actinomycetota bacterium]
MTLVYLGTDFHDTPLSKLEEFERVAGDIFDALNPQSAGLEGVVLLATCNRFEVYFETATFHESVERVTTLISEKIGQNPEDVLSSLNVLYADAVPRHLFQVASGLESMVIGEEEIAGQVKRSLTQAHKHGYSSKTLNHMFQSASSVAKAVTSKTGLGASGRSIITTALEIANQKLDGLSGKSALLIGTGAYSRVVVASLKRLGMSEISVFSRTGRANSFSASHGTTAITADQLAQTMAKVDLVVSASGSSNYAVNLELVNEVSNLRGSTVKPLVIIDVSLPKDVAPEASEVSGITVIDLEEIKRNVPAHHGESTNEAQQIIAKATDEFQQRISAQSVDPVLIALREHVGEWVQKEVEAVRRKSGDDAAAHIERSLRKVTNGILHKPTMRAKSLSIEGNQHDYIRAVQLLFDIEIGEDQDAKN